MQVNGFIYHLFGDPSLGRWQDSCAKVLNPGMMTIGLTHSGIEGWCVILTHQLKSIETLKL